MAESFCGNDCAVCAQKELLNCPGCKDGPGREFGGECRVAACCRKKEFESCDACKAKEKYLEFHPLGKQTECRKLKVEEAEQQKKEVITKRAKVLGNWLFILFWLVVPATIASLLQIDFFKETSPDIYIIGQIISAVCFIAHSAILLKIAPAEKRYRTAGICALASAVSPIFDFFTIQSVQKLLLFLVIALPFAIISIVGEYFEYKAHSAVLKDLDNRLSEKWIKLWKWLIGGLLTLFGGVLVMLLAQSLGLIVITIGLVIVVCAYIAKLVCLYLTAMRFRDYNPM